MRKHPRKSRIDIMSPILTIQSLLESCPAARDDENLLISSVWSRELELKHVNIHKMHVYLFMEMLMENKLTAASEILRIRDHIQNQVPELRGTNWTDPSIKISDIKDDDVY